MRQAVPPGSPGPCEPACRKRATKPKCSSAKSIPMIRMCASSRTPSKTAAKPIENRACRTMISNPPLIFPHWPSFRMPISCTFTTCTASILIRLHCLRSPTKNRQSGHCMICRRSPASVPTHLNATTGKTAAATARIRKSILGWALIIPGDCWMIKNAFIRNRISRWLFPRNGSNGMSNKASSTTNQSNRSITALIWMCLSRTPKPRFGKNSICLPMRRFWHSPLTAVSTANGAMVPL